MHSTAGRHDRRSTRACLNVSRARFVPSLDLTRGTRTAIVAVRGIGGHDRGMSEHWQPSLRSWVIGGVLSLGAFAAFTVAAGPASGFQLLALILLLDALVMATFAFIHRVK